MRYSAWLFQTPAIYWPVVVSMTYQMNMTHLLGIGIDGLRVWDLQ
jgi:hypothetical protein